MTLPTSTTPVSFSQAWNSLVNFLSAEVNHIVGGLGVSIDGLAKGDHFTAVLGAAYAGIVHVANNIGNSSTPKAA